MSSTALSTQFDSLTPIQMQVLQSLATGASVSAAASEAGIHRSTIYLWTRNLRGFDQALLNFRQQRASILMDELGDLAGLAIDTFRQILSDEKAPPSARLKAALEIVKVVEAQSAPVAVAAERTQTLPPAPPIEPKPATKTLPVGRNAPCPCGSPLKFKRCCGNPLSGLPNPATSPLLP